MITTNPKITQTDFSSLRRQVNALLLPLLRHYLIRTLSVLCCALNKTLILLRFLGKVLAVCLLGNMAMGVGFSGGLSLAGRLEGSSRSRSPSVGSC